MIGMYACMACLMYAARMGRLTMRTSGLQPQATSVIRFPWKAMPTVPAWMLARWPKTQSHLYAAVNVPCWFYTQCRSVPRASVALTSGQRVYTALRAKRWPKRFHAPV